MRLPAALVLLCTASMLALPTIVTAQQHVTGALGSPDAVSTIDGQSLPAQAPPFGGVINLDARESTPWWPPQVAPPEVAPNVLLIMTDDAGYGVSGTFGGVIPTPVLDSIAAEGLRYTQFHSTSLCSPTRAALITGRNHHAVGFGVIAEISTGFPGYDATIGLDNASVGSILRDQGYAVREVARLGETGSELPDILEVIASREISLIVNTPTPGAGTVRDAAAIRHAAIAEGVLCMTTIDTAIAAAHSMEPAAQARIGDVRSLDTWLAIGRGDG